MPKKTIVGMLALAALACSCAPQTGETSSSAQGDTVALQYAKGFQIIRTDHSVDITVFDPWSEGKIFARYTLDGAETNIESVQHQQLPAHLGRFGVFSSTVVGYFSLLGSQDAIAGISDGDLIYDSTLYGKYQRGQLPSLGMRMTDNYEAIAASQLDALVKSGFAESPSQDARYCGAGIPVIYVNDWTETHPLARAEWIKYIACFVGKSAEADSIFDAIAYAYRQTQERASGHSAAPLVLAGGEYKGTWYVPGGKSYFAQLLADAGASYAWSADSSVGSMSLSLEEVYDKSGEAQCWLSSQDASPRELIERDYRLQYFASIRGRRLYTYNKRMGAGGGNDYWESGACRPDLILQDIVSIVHGGDVADSLHYFAKLQDSSVTKHSAQ